MNKEAVQHERGPRNSTLKRQIAMLNGFRNETIKESPCNSLKKELPMFLLENDNFQKPIINNQSKNNLFANIFRSSTSKQNEQLLAAATAFKIASSIKSNNFENLQNFFTEYYTLFDRERTQNSLSFNGLVSFLYNSLKFF